MNKNVFIFNAGIPFSIFCNICRESNVHFIIFIIYHGSLFSMLCVTHFITIIKQESFKEIQVVNNFLLLAKHFTAPVGNLSWDVTSSQHEDLTNSLYSLCSQCNFQKII